MGILIFWVAVVAIAVIVTVNLYNRLVTLRNRYKNAYVLFIGFSDWIYPIKMTAVVAQ